MDEEKLCNDQLCWERRGVENTFGILIWRIIPMLTPVGTSNGLPCSESGLHNYLTQDGDSIVQAMLNSGIEVKADRLQGLTNMWGFHTTHAPTEVKN